MWLDLSMWLLHIEVPLQTTLPASNPLPSNDSVHPLATLHYLAWLESPVLVRRTPRAIECENAAPPEKIQHPKNIGDSELGNHHHPPFFQKVPFIEKTFWRRNGILLHPNPWKQDEYDGLFTSKIHGDKTETRWMTPKVPTFQKRMLFYPRNPGIPLNGRDWNPYIPIEKDGIGTLNP